MSDKIINRREGKVDLSEAGPGAFLQFTVGAFEQIETAYSDKEDHISFIMKALVHMKTSVFAKVLSASLHNPGQEAMPYGLKWEELTDRIMDALCLAIHGRTGAEQREYEQELLNKQIANRLKGIEENPQLAALLSSMHAGQPEQGQD